MSHLSGLLNFLDNSPTAWHAVENLRESLLKKSFIELQEGDSWKIQKGKNYFITRNGSSLIAFKTPASSPDKALVLASHTDSPAFKLKPKAEYLKENMVMLGVEVYGAPLLNSWLNRDLGIAGRVIGLNKKAEVQEKLVRLEDTPAVIPQLAIHLDRKVNEEGLILNRQEHLAALFGISDKEGLLEHLLLKETRFDKLLSHDLFLYPLEKAKLIGADKNLLASYRLDSLASVHAIVEAFLEAKKGAPNELQMAVFWDNEEIGSNTAQGAHSPFFNHVLERILLNMNLGREAYLKILTQSLCVSVDLSHTLHPNYIERHEPRHRILFNGGVALKTHAGHAYATNAASCARLLKTAESKGISIQKFVTKSDIPSGSTIGPIHAELTGMPTVDIGIGQLSMHAAREMIASPLMTI